MEFFLGSLNLNFLPVWSLCEDCKLFIYQVSFEGKCFTILLPSNYMHIYNWSKNWQRTSTRLKNHPTPSLHVFYQDACNVTSWLTSQLYKSSIDQMQWAISPIVNHYKVTSVIFMGACVLFEFFKNFFTYQMFLMFLTFLTCIFPI
jgi:hypothetical protein